MDIGPDQRRIYVVPDTPPPPATPDPEEISYTAEDAQSPYMFGLARGASIWLLAALCAGLELYFIAGTAALPVIGGFAALWAACYGHPRTDRPAPRNARP